MTIKKSLLAYVTLSLSSGVPSTSATLKRRAVTIVAIVIEESGVKASIAVSKHEQSFKTTNR